MIEKYNIEETSKLTSEQANEFIDLLKCSQAV
jgi:succinate dehydrogenase flavin-adding protein (antitoxin of CptAB toxin-antitoxin module)